MRLEQPPSRDASLRKVTIAALDSVMSELFGDGMSCETGGVADDGMMTSAGQTGASLNSNDSGCTNEGQATAFSHQHTLSFGFTEVLAHDLAE